jgi:hypothetical protein
VDLARGKIEILSSNTVTFGDNLDSRRNVFKPRKGRVEVDGGENFEREAEPRVREEASRN